MLLGRARRSIPTSARSSPTSAQIDVNTTFALSYPERRPFFQEGSDLYTTWLDVIYTRSINDPQVAGKLTGTYGRTSLLYLAARDRNTPVLIPGEEESYQPLLENGFHDIRSVSNLFRLRRSLLEDWRVGLTVTDRRLQAGLDGSGTVFSLDAFVRFLTNYNIDLQALVSHTEEPNDTLMTRGLNAITIDEGRHTLAFDGESFWGRGLFFGIQRSGRVAAPPRAIWSSVPPSAPTTATSPRTAIAACSSANGSASNRIAAGSWIGRPASRRSASGARPASSSAICSPRDQLAHSLGRPR